MEKKDESGLTKFDRYRLRDVEGYRKRKREWAKTESQKEYRRNYMRLWREKNREHHNKQAKESHQRNKHKHIGEARKQHLRRHYGITEAFYNELNNKQNGVCKICGNDPKIQGKSKMNKILHIDHDHKLNVIRGLLCSRCNGALGWYEKYRKEINKYLDNNLSVDKNQLKMIL